MRTEEEINKKLDELRELYLKLDRFKDVHKLDMVEGFMFGLRFARGENVHFPE